MVTNVATYGFQIVAARLLGPGEFGSVASMMALLLVVGVVQLGLQATAARRVSGDVASSREIERTVLALTYRASALVGVVMLVASPLVWQLLRLDSIVPALLVAVCSVPLSIMGGQAGVLQGERRWLSLAIVYLALGVPRLVLGAAFIWVRPTETFAIAGVTVAQFVPAVAGYLALRRRDRAPVRLALRPVAKELFAGSVTLLGYFVISNVDIVVARNVLDDHASGLYAGGLILTKAVLFLPQFVVVIAFPSLASDASRRLALLKALGLVGALGVVAVLGAWLLSGVALVFVGGGEYSDVQHRLWIFAVLGTLLAVLQVLVYSDLAQRSRASTYALWIAVLAVLALGSQQSSVTGLVWTVTCIDALLVAVLTGITWRRLRKP
ncbi:MAG: oligosaccharide flippase family protein [Nocardioides sp.]|nr:oligosaccharide flippase family protein [Nocardioides sp.]